MSGRLDQLIAAYIDGELTEIDAKELLQSVSSDLVAQDEFIALCRIERHLAAELGRIGIAEAVAATLAAEGRRCEDQVMRQARHHVQQSSWRHRAAARRRSFWRRANDWWLAAAAVLTLIPLWWWSGHGLRTPSPIAVLSSTSHDVHVIRGGHIMPAQEGMSLLSEDRIEVEAGPEGRFTEVTYPDRSSLRIKPATAVRLWDEIGAKRVQIERGDVCCEVAHQVPGKSMKLLTDRAEAEVVGTQFTLSVDHSQTRLAVEKGEISLRRADGKTVTVRGGYLVTVGDGVAFEPVAIRHGTAPVDPQGLAASWRRAIRTGEDTHWDDEVEIVDEPTGGSRRCLRVRSAARWHSLVRMLREPRVATDTFAITFETWVPPDSDQTQLQVMVVDESEKYASTHPVDLRPGGWQAHRVGIREFDGSTLMDGRLRLSAALERLYIVQLSAVDRPHEVYVRNIVFTSP